MWQPRYHVRMAKRTHRTKPARGIERKATPVLSLRFNNQTIPLRSPQEARLLLAELCHTATQNIQTFHAVQREVEAQRVKLRDSATVSGLSTQEAAALANISRATIDRAVASGELEAVITVSGEARHRVIPREAFIEWNRKRIAQKKGTDTP